MLQLGGVQNWAKYGTTRPWLTGLPAGMAVLNSIYETASAVAKYTEDQDKHLRLKRVDESL